jgi:hypothetical protein
MVILKVKGLIKGRSTGLKTAKWLSNMILQIVSFELFIKTEGVFHRRYGVGVNSPKIG